MRFNKNFFVKVTGEKEKFTGTKMKKNDIITIKVEKMINQGICLGRYEGKIVLVDGCLPEEIVQAKIKKVKKDYIEAIALDFLEKSPHRITPKCKYFGLCGGCKLQNLNYQQQLEIKKSFVEDAFKRISKITDIKINDVIGADEEFFYRNKMEFSFAKRWLFEDTIYTDKEKEFALGLHIPKQFEKVIHLEECFLQSQFSNEVRNDVANFLFNKEITIHSLKNREGLLKALLIREAKNTPEKLVGLITTRFEKSMINELANYLLKKYPEITTFVNIVSPPDLSSTLPHEIITIYGKGYIIDKLYEYQFEIYPNTFFQTNTKQAEKLFFVVKNYLETQAFFFSNSILVDLYSGVGVIGIILSKYFKKVIGFEEVKESVLAAKRNAVLNKIDNIHFEQQNLLRGFKIDNNLLFGNELTIVIDPPRSGITENLIASIIKLKPSRIIYISCNPVTQARDLAQLKNFYKIEFVQPVDMFPQTFHIENIVILKLFYQTT